MTDLSCKKLSVDQLARLLETIIAQQFEVYGPVRREHAIMYDRLYSLNDLPVGIVDEQDAGFYRVHDAGDGRLFGYTTGPDTWKKYLFPKEEILYSATAEDSGIVFKTDARHKRKRAFFAIRSCDIHAIAVQDRVFLEGEYVDGAYAARRDDLLLVAVNCSHAVSTCFCSSLNTGPKATSGYDIALTEVLNGEHFFVAQAGSEAGQTILATLGSPDADANALAQAEQAIANAARQSRTLPVAGLKEKIYAQLNNEAFWQSLGERCLHCANCTLVCPTCFCSNVEDRTDLSGEQHQRVRYWDSCFNESHSHIAGGSIRQTTDSRYRQWFSHKLASWQDQFQTLGCTGCGRCVTWCPVAIDITAEAHRVQALPLGKGGPDEP